MADQWGRQQTSRAYPWIIAVLTFVFTFLTASQYYLSRAQSRPLPTGATTSVKSAALPGAGQSP
jgi:hypothetical protein